MHPRHGARAPTIDPSRDHSPPHFSIAQKFTRTGICMRTLDSMASHNIHGPGTGRLRNDPR